MRKQETGSSRIHEFETVYRDSSRQSAYLDRETFIVLHAETNINKDKAN